MKKPKNVTKYIRVNEEDWNQAMEICSDIGTTLSAAFGQMVKQIIIQKRIPFQLTLHELGDSLDQDLESEKKKENQGNPLKELYDELGMDMSEYASVGCDEDELEEAQKAYIEEDDIAALGKLYETIFND